VTRVVADTGDRKKRVVRQNGWLYGLLVGIALLVSTQDARSAALEARFDPACLPWDSARYQAQKLFMTVDLEVDAQLLAEPPLASLGPIEGRTPLMPGAQTLALQVTTRGPGWRMLRGELLLDAPTGAILQYASLREPSPRHRVYRFSDSGPQRSTAKPRDGEGQLPPDRWTDVDVRQHSYAVGAVEGPVLEVSTLLYLLAASPLAAPGEVMRFNGYATSADELYEVTATVGDRIRLPVDYRVAGAGALPQGASSSRRSVIGVLPIRITGRSYAQSGSAAGFDILGLHDVEFLLDPEQRVIAALRARMPTVGGVQFQLRSLGLKDSLPEACSIGGR
jgi:hypothetical protein